MTDYPINRRQFLQSTTTLGLGLGLAGASFAKSSANTDRQLVVIILRGGMDGLSAVFPFQDKQLKKLREPLLVPENEILKIDQHFAMHPAFKNCYQFYLNNELSICHAVATPYRQRSHFDGQNILEIGLTRADDRASGWLNRAVAINQQYNAIAIGQAVPPILRGDADISSWTPSQVDGPSDDTLDRLLTLYNHDAFLSPRLQQALQAQDLVGDAINESSMTGRQRRSRNNLQNLIAPSVEFLSAENGPNIAVLQSDGWDTHANQGNAQGQLARKFTALDTSIQSLRQGLAERWQTTIVLVVTEFGRTVSVNGTRGTDHGTAGVALIAGGALSHSLKQTKRSGGLLTEWPGLAPQQLYENRDLFPQTDMRAVFKSVLHHHLGYAQRQLDQQIFPGSENIPYFSTLA